MADAHGDLVLRGRAAEMEQELPFGVARRARRLAELGPQRLERLAGDSSDELARRPARGGGAGSAGSRTSATARIAPSRAARGAGANAPVVIALDDVHWADEASLELIAHLLHHPPRRGVLLALALRPAPAAAVAAGAGRRRARRPGRTAARRR